MWLFYLQYQQNAYFNTRQQSEYWACFTFQINMVGWLDELCAIDTLVLFNFCLFVCLFVCLNNDSILCPKFNNCPRPRFECQKVHVVSWSDDRGLDSHEENTVQYMPAGLVFNMEYRHNSHVKCTFVSCAAFGGWKEGIFLPCTQILVTSTHLKRQ